MDPVTAVGLAASVIQLVDLGAKLSVKLFTVSKQLKNAAGYYEDIGQSVASTNAVVQQLGTLLNDEKHQCLFGIEAIRTTTQSIAACRELFSDLYDDITPKAKADSNSAVKALAEWKHRLVLPYKQAQLERKQSKIHELKATLTLNLNIVVLAMQISLHDHSDEGKAILLEQRDAVLALHKATTPQHPKAAPPDRATPISSYKNMGQSPRPSRSAALPAAGKANARTTVLDDPPVTGLAQRPSDSPCTPDRSENIKRGVSPKPNITDFDGWRVSNDRARFKAHARLVEEILALLERHSGVKSLRIQSDMHFWALKFHYDFWCKLGRHYCLRELLPEISDCPLVFEYWLDEDTKKNRRKTTEKPSRHDYHGRSRSRSRSRARHARRSRSSSDGSSPISDREYVLMPVKSPDDPANSRGLFARRHGLPIEVPNFLEMPQVRPRAASRDRGPPPVIINMGGPSREERRLSRQDDTDSSSAAWDEDAELVGLLSQFTTLTGDDLAFFSSLDKASLDSTAI